jgi:hypothetical protein
LTNDDSTDDLGIFGYGFNSVLNFVIEAGGTTGTPLWKTNENGNNPGNGAVGTSIVQGFTSLWMVKPLLQ